MAKVGDPAARTHSRTEISAQTVTLSAPLALIHMTGRGDPAELDPDGGTDLESQILHTLTPEELSTLPATLTVPQAGRILGIGRDAAYAAASRGELPTLRLGRRLVVPTGRLRSMLIGPEQHVPTGPLEAPLTGDRPEAVIARG